MVGVSIAWVPVIKEMSGGQVFIYINEVGNYLAPPFAAIFLLAVLVPRVNEKVRLSGVMCCRLGGVLLSDNHSDIERCRPGFLQSAHCGVNMSAPYV